MALLLWDGGYFADAVSAIQDTVKRAREWPDANLLAACLQNSGFIKIRHHVVNGNKAKKAPIEAGLEDWKEAHKRLVELGLSFRAQKVLQDIEDFEQRRA
jgi:hypothetical protein